MDIKELILSDLETSLDSTRLELVDRWIINETKNFSNVQIENSLENQLILAEAVNKKLIISRKTMGASKEGLLGNFIKKYCHCLNLLDNYESLDHYDPETEGEVRKDIGSKSFSYSLERDQKSYSIINTYENSLGDKIWVTDNKLSGMHCEEFSIYSSDGVIIVFMNDIITIGYHERFYHDNPELLHHYYSSHSIKNPPEINILNYGLQYIGEIEIDKLLSPNYEGGGKDLLLFNDQKNKDFCKGFVACPFLFTSSGIFTLSDMFLPIRRTGILDKETRVVSNYLYKL